MFSPSTGQCSRHSRPSAASASGSVIASRLVSVVPKAAHSRRSIFLQRHVTRMHLLGVQLRRSYIGGQRIAPCQFQVLLDGRLLTFHPQAVTFFL